LISDFRFEIGMLPAGGFQSAIVNLKSEMARHDLTLAPDLGPPSGSVSLVFDHQHLTAVVRDAMLRATSSLEISTADFKAMLVPQSSGDRDAPSVVEHLIGLATRGVEVRVLHSGVPSGPALAQMKRASKNKSGLPDNLTVRRCPRLHAKAVVVDANWLYLGSANLTGAGLGAKGPTRRNFEWGMTTEDPALVDAVLGRFNDLWEGTHCAGCGRRDVCPVPLEEPRL